MKTPVRTRLLSALLSLVMLVSLLPVSVFAAEPASGTWEKVTEAQEDWSGQYLIVYEKGSLIMDGSLSALDKEGNKVDVTITDGKIVGDYAKYAFTIAPMTGGWSVQSASGKYISGKSGSNKIITGSTPELNTITFADGNVKIASNNTTLQYNAAATNGTRFRYYKSENQQPVALYKLSTVPARESGIVTDLTTLQNGDKVVVFNPANKKALSSVYNGFYNTGVDVELTGGKLTGYTDAELWTVNRTESGAYTFSTADGKKLSMDKNTPAPPWTRPMWIGSSAPPPRRTASTSRTWAAAAIWSGSPRRTTGAPTEPSAATRLCLPSSFIWWPSPRSRASPKIPPLL